MTAENKALRHSLYETLSDSAALTALLGGARIHKTPRKAETLPCITLGQTVNRDWTTGTETGSEITLHIWTSAESATEVHEIILALRAILDDRSLPLRNGDPAGLRHDFTQVRIDPDGETLHGIVRYQAEAQISRGGVFRQAAA